MLGEYKELPQNLLILDFTYQRSLNHTRIDKMIKNFDESLIGTITVAKRSNGTFAVIDGQHRLAVLKAKTFPTIPCMVYPEMSVQEEAQMFAYLNSYKQKISPLDMFWALIGSGDEKQRQILNAIENNGFEVAKRAGARKNMKSLIAAIGMIQRIEKNYGLDILNQTLKLINGVWPENGEALTGQFLLGLAIFINRFKDNPKFSLDTAKKNFMPLVPETVLTRARNQAKIYNLDVPRVVTDILFESYNKNLKRSNRLQWDGKIDKSETERGEANVR